MVKFQERILINEKVEISVKMYDMFKMDFEKYFDNLEKLE